MRPFRFLRGVIGTALVWATSWAVVGALGGLVVAGSIFGLRVLLIGYPARGFLPDFALAGALSAATAWLTLRIARQAPPARTVSELSGGDQSPTYTTHARESQPVVPS